MVNAGVPSRQIVSWPSCLGGGGSTAQGGCPGCVESRGTGRDGGEGGCILASDTKVFFTPSPTSSFLWFYGLLTGSRLSSGYERRSPADPLQGFWQGLQEERDLQQSSCAGPDDPRGDLPVLGQFNTPGWPIKVWVKGLIVHKIRWAGLFKGKRVFIIFHHWQKHAFMAFMT